MQTDVKRDHIGEAVMDMKLNAMLENLADAGCGQQEIDNAARLYEAGQVDELVRHFKRCRCILLDEMHESQRKVDRMDFLIRRTEKEAVR